MIRDIEEILDGYINGSYTLAQSLAWIYELIDIAGQLALDAKHAQEAALDALRHLAVEFRNMEARELHKGEAARTEANEIAANAAESMADDCASLCEAFLANIDAAIAAKSQP